MEDRALNRLYRLPVVPIFGAVGDDGAQLT
jgi:hypothetical protein